MINKSSWWFAKNQGWPEEARHTTTTNQPISVSFINLHESLRCYHLYMYFRKARNTGNLELTVAIVTAIIARVRFVELRWCIIHASMQTRIGNVPIARIIRCARVSSSCIILFTQNNHDISNKIKCHIPNMDILPRCLHVCWWSISCKLDVIYPGCWRSDEKVFCTNILHTSSRMQFDLHSRISQIAPNWCYRFIKRGGLKSSYAFYFYVPNSIV